MLLQPDAVNEIDNDMYLMKQWSYHAYSSTLQQCSYCPQLSAEHKQAQQGQQASSKKLQAGPAIPKQRTLFDMFTKARAGAAIEQKTNDQTAAVMTDPAAELATNNSGAAAAASDGQTTTAAAAAASAAASDLRPLPAGGLKPFPERKKLHGGTFSQTYLTRRVVQHWESHKQVARSVIHAARASSISLDYQFYPCKMVHTVGGDRAAVAIFNMVDAQTGEICI